MTNEHTHAEKIVAHFKDLLSDEELRCIDPGHFDELALMIEAAIDASVLDAQERTADKIMQLANDVRNLAERGH